MYNVVYYKSRWPEISSSHTVQSAKLVKNIIELLSLNVTLGQSDILRDLSLQIPAAQWCSIVGPSGCGKSTLLRALAGLIEGTAEKFVTDFKTPAFVFQDPTLMPWRTVRDNVVLPLELKGSSDGRRPRIDMLSIQETIECVGLNSDDLIKFPRQLSGGMRMRVSMARALVTQPDILFMDEPFAALDSQTRDLLLVEMQLIWQKTQKTIIFVTHNVPEAAVLGSRVAVFSARPSIVKKIIDVDYKRPRVAEDENLSTYEKEILSSLRHQGPK